MARGGPRLEGADDLLGLPKCGGVVPLLFAFVAIGRHLTRRVPRQERAILAHPRTLIDHLVSRRHRARGAGVCSNVADVLAQVRVSSASVVAIDLDADHVALLDVGSDLDVMAVLAAVEHLALLHRFR